MRPIILFVCFFLSSASLLQAQKTTGSVQGRITDTLNKQSLKDASVTVLNKTDSSLIKFTLAKADGSFEITDLPFGTHLLLVSFQSYGSVYESFTIDRNNPDKRINTIYLQPVSNQLGDVVVKASPIVVKKDTIDFNANMFKTKPNANTEDLLKKLPGMEVDRDGNVKAQGQSVTRVLVDGKRFFGDDPKLATRNLPTDVIDRIQVIDALSDQAAFSGFDDGNREKTINIITKKDRRKGWFGKASVGAGSEGRYENSLSVNRFNGNQQISFIGQGNNTNKQSFSVQDILGSFGGGNLGGGGRGGAGGGGVVSIGGLGGGAFRQAGNFVSNLGNGGNGIIETWAGGLNYRDVWSKKTEAYGSYFYNNTQVNRVQDRITQNVLSDTSSLFNNQNSVTNNRNQNHRFNFNIETKLDSFSSIIFRPNVSFQESENNVTTNTLGTRNKLINVNNASYTGNSKNKGMSGGGELLFRHRFKTAGRSFSVSANLTASTNDGSGSSYTTQLIYRDPLPIRFDTLDQRFTSYSDSKNWSSNVSYTEPVGKGQLIELSYNYGNNESKSGRETFRFNKANGLYDIKDTTQTNLFRNTFESHRAGLNYRIQKNQLNFSFGGAVQWASLTSINDSKLTTISQNVVNFFPNANLTWNKNRTKNLRINYRGATNQPSATQLQPVFDLTNPLSVSGGNPSLKPEFRHNFNMFWSSFDVMKQTNFFTSLNFSATQNRIANSTIVYLPGTALPPGIPTGSVQPGAIINIPLNLNGQYSVSGFMNFGFPLKKPKSNLNFGTNGSYNQDVSLINSKKNYNRNLNITQSVTWVMNIKERFDFNLTSRSSFNAVRNTVNSSQNQNFFTQSVDWDMTWSSKSGWMLISDFTLTAYMGRTDGFNRTIPLWTPSIAKQVFKNKSGEVRLSVFDILNKNVFIDRTVSGNTITDVQTVVLKQYFMLSFTYNLRRFGAGQGPGNPFMNMMRQGGGNMMMMRPPGGGGRGN